MENHLREQQIYFNHDIAYSKNYESSLNAWKRSYLERIDQDLLRGKYVGKVLVDVGTGSGYVAIENAKKGVKVYASDISSSALKLITEYSIKYGLNNLSAIRATAEKLPIKSRSVDYLVSNSVLEHLPNEMSAILEWKRVVKRGGKIFVTVPIKYKYIWPFFGL